MPCIQSNRQEVKCLSLCFTDFPNAAVVSSSLEDWVSFGAINFQSLKAANLGAGFQQLTNTALPAPLLLRVLHYLVDTVARWVSEARVFRVASGCIRTTRHNSFLGSNSHLLARVPHCTCWVQGKVPRLARSALSPPKYSIVSINTLMLSNL